MGFDAILARDHVAPYLVSTNDLVDRFTRETKVFSDRRGVNNRRVSPVALEVRFGCETCFFDFFDWTWRVINDTKLLLSKKWHSPNSAGGAIIKDTRTGF